MSLSVYTEGLGFFHKGSSGKGIAQADVCLSPPPPPTGPAPIPYVNSLSASSLSKGSKSVKVDGQPTALEDQSYVSTSTGDEGGTQGGNVITHKTKGKGYFKLWSFVVKVEGKGVCRHDDMMGQNCASTPPGCVDMKALVRFLLMDDLTIEPCPPDKPYPGHNKFKPTTEQYEAVKGGPCWECQRDLPAGNWESVTLPRSGKVKTKASAYTSGLKDPKKFTPDHQPPLDIAWYMGGCHMEEEDFRRWAEDPNTVKPHCKIHYCAQGGTIRGVTSGKKGKAAFDACVSFLGI